MSLIEGDNQPLGEDAGRALTPAEGEILLRIWDELCAKAKPLPDYEPRPLLGVSRPCRR